MIHFLFRRPWRFLVLAVAALGVAAGAAASEIRSPYAGQEARAVKALSAGAIEGYLAGKGMELALAAELNNYPGPRHLLDLADKLGLKPAQVAAIEASFKSMQAEAQRLGRAIVEKETELDRTFASGRAQAAEVERLTAEIGSLHGRLRAVHLNAHLAVRGHLNDATVARYNQLRGYGGDAKAGGQGGHGGQRHH
jgi:hypothetical protein